MKTNLTSKNLIPSFTFVVLLFSTPFFAQPANDDCSGAFEFTIAADEASCVPVNGNTVGATGSTIPSNVCSTSWFGDDIWFKFTTDSNLPEGAIIIKAFFGTETGDIQAVGMAIYDTCSVEANPIFCFSSDDPNENQLEPFFTGNLLTDHTYYVRIWSGLSPNDNSGTFRVCGFYEPPSDDVVLWDGGQFDGGMGDWTTVGITSDTAVWTYKACSCSEGFWRQSVINSPTAYNGAMIFDADLLNYDVTSQPYPFHEGELISPVIDCSTFEAVSLKYYQSYDALNGATYYSYSLDGGNTWVDQIEVNDDIAGNQSTPTPSFKRHYISEAAGVDSFRIKFIFDGDYYNWIIDDVQLIQPERNNLIVMDNFYTIAPNAMTPYSQVAPFSFLADVRNAGAEPQTNVNLNISIVDNTTSTEVFSADLPYNTIPADSLVENVPFTDYFTADGSITTYTGTYEISSDSVDFDPSDNFQSFDFMTTDSVFANEFGATRTIQPAANNWEGDMEPHSWAFGNYFYIVNGDDWYASSATFGLGNADAPGIAGRLISLYLYRWDEDTNEDGNMDPGERTRVAFNVYEILGTEQTADLITVPLLNFPSNEPGPVDLESNQAYVLMIEYVTLDEVDFALVAGEINFDAMTFRSELDGIPEGNARYAYMLGVNGDLEAEPYSSAGFVTRMAPVVRLNIAMIESADEVLDASNIIEISPNPADNKINLNIDLTEMHERVNIRILDVNGRLILDQPHDNVKQETLQFDISNYASGAYFLHFITESGVRTKRFIVQH